MRRLRRDHPRTRFARKLRSLPAMRPAPQARRRRAGAHLFLDDGALDEWDAHLEPTDPLEFADGKDLPRAHRRGAKGVARQRGCRDRACAHRWPARRLGRVPLRVHGRLDGLRRRREARAALRARDSGAAARRAAAVLGRRAHAGGHPQLDANGQDGGGARAAQGRDAAVRQRAAAPDHGRRRGQLRAPRRRQHRRTGGAHRLRRAARHREHDPSDACPRASSAASSCSRTAWSTAS